MRSFSWQGQTPCLSLPLTPSERVATLERMFASGGDALLTKRQQEIWEFLVQYVDSHGYPPTVREIGERVGLASPSTVHAHLANLERAGYLRRDPTKPRALELTGLRRQSPRSGRESSAQSLPLVGEIAAGAPLLAEDQVEEYMTMPEQLVAGGAD